MRDVDGKGRRALYNITGAKAILRNTRLSGQPHDDKHEATYSL